MSKTGGGSPEYIDFLNWLGTTVQLKGWHRFRGGLDVNSDTTGTHTLYTTLDAPGIGEFEILFHVSTYLPFSEDNPQQVSFFLSLSLFSACLFHDD